MLEPPLGKLLENIDSRYLLVNVTAMRAREIAQEAEMQGIMLEDKPVKLAIEEVADHKITASLRPIYRQ